MAAYAFINGGFEDPFIKFLEDSRYNFFSHGGYIAEHGLINLSFICQIFQRSRNIQAWKHIENRRIREYEDCLKCQAEVVSKLHCPICHFDAVKYNEMQKHFNKCHKAQKSNACGSCNLRFLTSDQKNQHINSQHHRFEPRK